MEFYPQYPQREKMNLAGAWDFAFRPDEKDPANPDFGNLEFTEAMPVPGVFDVFPDRAGQRGTAFYRKNVTLDFDGKVFLKLGGIGLWAAIFWDRKPVGTIDLPYSGVDFTFDGGGKGKHELLIVIDNRLDFQRTPLFSPNYDFYGHGGIYREVELFSLPVNAIDRVFVSTVCHETGKVKIRVSAEAQGLEYAFDNGEFQPAPGNEFEVSVPDFRLWSPESPQLHTITVRNGGDCIIEEFGIRTVTAGNGKLYLNGQAIRLRGFCRHEAHPQFGPALPLHIVMEDIKWLKDLGCNFVRGTHYPQDQRFLALCDRAGLLVWEETLGWGDGLERLITPHFQDAQVRQLPWMVKNSYNHPSVIMWGFLNEGFSSVAETEPLYKKLITTLKELDPSRPVTYASNKNEGDIMFKYADIVSMNSYPGWYSRDRDKFRPLDEIAKRFNDFIAFMKANGLSDKPYIISEVGAGAIYGWRDRFAAHWSEEYQRDYLAEVCRYFSETPEITGVALWHFADCRTYSTGHALARPRAFNNKGIMDEYRRPKLAYDAVKECFQKF